MAPLTPLAFLPRWQALRPVIAPHPAPMAIELECVAPALFNARLADGTLLAESTARPFADSASRLIEIGIAPDQIVALKYGDHVLLVAPIGRVARGMQGPPTDAFTHGTRVSAPLGRVAGRKYQ
jgi:hypothetical protein